MLTLEETFWNNVLKSETCWFWRGPFVHNGYGSFRGGAAKIRAHRYAWVITHGRIPHGQMVLHHCDNRACVRPDHLFLGTAKDNTADMMNKCRNVPPPLHRGTEMWKAKLNEYNVRLIRHLYASGLGPTYLAREFGVSKGAITSIVAKRCWKHVS